VHHWFCEAGSAWLPNTSRPSDPQTLFTTLSRVTTWNHRLASLRLRSKPAAEVGGRVSASPPAGGAVGDGGPLSEPELTFIQEWVASFLIELKANGIKKGEKLPRRSESGVLKLRGQEKGNGRVKGPSVLIRKGSLCWCHTQHKASLLAMVTTTRPVNTVVWVSSSFSQKQNYIIQII